MNNVGNKRAFTIIELIIVITIIGILVLFGMPRLLGYVEKAQLTKIMHDTKVMEAMMEDELTRNLNSNYQDFVDNGKDLGLLIEANRLFEKEGKAKNLEYVPMKDEIDGLSKHLSAQIDENDNEKFGMGGPVVQEEEEEFKELYERYKIIPEEYKEKAGINLKGTFYSNEAGKVYYEIDKPLGIKSESRGLNCSIEPLLDYTFEHEIGKIVKYHGDAEHLVIPSYFLVDGECWPVRIIGKGAFMRGGYKSIVIPDTVITIEEDAFKDNNLDNIYIPGSVTNIGGGAFDGNYNVSYGGSSGSINGGSGGGSYTRPGGGSGSITYRPPTSGEAGIVFNPSTGRIVKGGNSGYIPPYITVGDKEYPVKKIAKGAYQGQGLITVILPETLEIIEDYAFSGNQLIGIRIPFSVYHIGHYAFSFNEVWKEGDIAGPERKATMKTMLIKDREQFDKIDKLGNIMEGEEKLDYLKGDSEEEGPDVKLLNHIWVTSIGNIVIDEEYIGENEPNTDVIFNGLSPAAFDGDLSTYHSGHGIVGWNGDLGNREITVVAEATGNGSASSMDLIFYNSNNGKLVPIGRSSNSISIRGVKTAVKVIVPKEANHMAFEENEGARIYEVGLSGELNLPKEVNNVTSESTSNSITLNWEQNESEYERVAIYRDGKFITYANGTTYTDKPLYAGEEYKYEIVAINNSGNASDKWIKHIASTIKMDVIFNGLSPAAFDGNLSTYHVGHGIIRWDGDLENREITVVAEATGNGSASSMDLIFYNSSNEKLIPIGRPSNSISIRGSKTTIKVIVPKGANRIAFERNPSARIYNIGLSGYSNLPKKVFNVNSESTDNSITLNWEQNENEYERVAIYRDDKFITYANGISYVDKPLYAGREYKYEIIAINNSGNASDEWIEHIASTIRPDVIFNGLSPAAFDGDLSTYHTGHGIVEWDGDLENREITVVAMATGNGSASSMDLIFYNSNNGKLIPIGSSSNSISIRGSKTIVKVIVPKGANRMAFERNPNARIYNIGLSGEFNLPKEVSNITSESTHNSITLNWEQNENEYERVAIYRDGKFVAYVNGHSYTNINLVSDTEYNYEIIAINSSGNASDLKVSHIVKTK